MNCKEIITLYVRWQGFDGLYNSDLECGCLLDDLMPCDEPRLDCEPGYKLKCDCGDHNFHVGAKDVADDKRLCPAIPKEEVLNPFEGTIYEKAE